MTLVFKKKSIGYKNVYLNFLNKFPIIKNLSI